MRTLKQLQHKLVVLTTYTNCRQRHYAFVWLFWHPLTCCAFEEKGWYLHSGYEVQKSIVRCFCCGWWPTQTYRLMDVHRTHNITLSEHNLYLAF